MDGDGSSTGRIVMRLSLVVAVVLAVGLTVSSQSLAAPKRQGANANYDACVALAKQRGWTYSDLNDGGARRFVRNCLKSGPQRASSR
jgi:hypothetical protein